ncbi:MAG: Trigger factor [Microgenomates group bacterium GW2011_GWC1_37_8]|uniref:Trigger factor n=1 Tax=Candidatus Woesebacteria bacterium GW2011_GWB1_38_8 TaxID=1618570 RepID=A0A0G0NIX6_9BACT|nr:MAG: Trigger factor [Microgenomates group bacterium GW2011_GWC1_37_8]KKQ85854.1 MAG: Trigger factor [Candidatus Woesebacteria bacterium GW2011_GWB1_38_8]
MPTNKLSNNEKAKDAVIARSDDGTIQITFTVPFTDIEKARNDAANQLGKDIVVPGFRKGNAPIQKVLESIPENTLLEKSLSLILPNLLSEAIKKHNLKPAIYPKFELLKTNEGEDWQIRAVTCEILPIELGDYKKEITGLARTKSIWTPQKGKKDEKESHKEMSRAEKEQEVIKVLINTVKVKIAKVLIDEEVNSRLSKLLERIEKLGLNLEGYLASIGKTAQSLRSEYEAQSQSALALDLILTEIAKIENIQVGKNDVDEAISASKADPGLAKELDTPERRQFIEVILKRRKVLDNLISLT